MTIRIAVLVLCVVLSACNAQVAPGSASTRSETTTPPAAAPGNASTRSETTPAPEVAPVDALTRNGTASPEAAGPPVIDGVYTYHDCQGEGGCPFHNWRTTEQTPVLAAESATANILATLAPGEWVVVEAVETRLVPVRGVVREGAHDLRAGEVVYALEYEGEGETNYWVRGRSGAVAEPEQIAWEEKAAPPAIEATLGTWARVKRANGQVGWVHEPHFECMGPLAGDENCRG